MNNNIVARNIILVLLFASTIGLCIYSGNERKKVHEDTIEKAIELKMDHNDIISAVKESSVKLKVEVLKNRIVTEESNDRVVRRVNFFGWITLGVILLCFLVGIVILIVLVASD